MKLNVFYSSSYVCTSAPVLARLATTAEELKQFPFVKFVVPRPFDPKLLEGIHSARYIDAFMQGQEPLASSQGIKWTPGIRDATLAMLSGQIEGVDSAFENGIAMNIARGFHHAVRERGSGYCPMNGLALVAHTFPGKRVLVLDCDEHGGNGTEEFAAEFPNLFNVSIFGTRFGCIGGTRSWAFQVSAKSEGFDKYLAVLQRAESLIKELRPDILLYQAGADCHEKDPKSRTGLTTEEMFHRDCFVFQIAKSNAIPILFMVAGGYQHPKKIAELNANTVRAAESIYSPSDSRSLPIL